MNRVRAGSMLLFLAILFTLGAATLLPAHFAHAEDGESPKLEIEI